MLLTLVYFLFALLLLVIIHEFGHFQIARWCGVKVLRFSFGFGPVLFRWFDKRNTEYAFSLVPLGGYVKMLDETEGNVAEDEKHQAFNRKSVWVRIAIVLAGPLFNFIFAFVALWLVLVIGVYSLAPMIDAVKPNSIAAKAGLQAHEEIIAIDGNKINSWRDFQYILMPKIGSDDVLHLTVKSKNAKKEVNLPLNNWSLDEKKPDPLASLGIEPFIPSIPPVVGEVVEKSPASKADLRVGDEVLSVDDRPVTDWLELVNYVKQRPNTKITLQIKRHMYKLSLQVLTGSQKKEGVDEGFLGLRSKKVDWPKSWLRLEREAPLMAVGTAFLQTYQLTKTTFVLMGRLVTGKLSLNNISGPVGIAQSAGDSGRSGVTAYLFFLAMISISLGALNLLPIPLLDGGHLLYYVLELVRGKPLPDEVKSVGIYMGAVLLFFLMFIALTNDISRLTN